MPEIGDLSTQILIQIRDEIRQTRTELSERIDLTRTELSGRIDQTNTRLDHVESTLQELATQQVFIVRGVKALGARDNRFEKDLEAIRQRLDALEKNPPLNS